jgi:NAD+ synthase
VNKAKIIDHITKWLDNNLKDSGCSGFVVGVSGGIDSALTSTLAANTNHPLILLNMPINQAPDQFSRSNEQIQWLKKNYPNVRSYTIDLTITFNSFKEGMELTDPSLLGLVNSASRLRMAALYSVANT